ncbi:hypothetical protein [Exiguobacterium algae]|uniref:hypothetical protein n=1 Tax=Exiguobacterium algae TaxID=2751250 RepID=UPI001BEB03EE|nr:hypothetical protein [Exiguobacterium algae]
MKQDERGYVLILVLVTMAALAVLSLAAIQVNLATNKQTVIRVDETQLDTDVKSTLNLLVSDLRKTFPIHDVDTVPSYMETQQAFQDAVDGVLVSNETYTGTRLSGNNTVIYSISRSATDRVNAPFTTVLTLTATGTTNARPEQPTQTATYSQEVYLTALPSFLYYVLGSDDALTINGPPMVTGDIYAETSLSLQRTAMYQLGTTRKSIDNLSTSRFYLDGQIDLAPGTSCTGCGTSGYFATSLTPSANDQPNIGQIESSFSPFHFDYSIIQYANRFKSSLPKFSYDTPPIDSIFSSGLLTDDIEPFVQQSYTAPGETTPLTRSTEYLDPQKLDAIDSLTIIRSPNSNATPMMITETVASSNVPLLFDGDVTIDGLNGITISRPLLINGNLTIRGEVSFNTTVYTLEDAFIDRAEITGVSHSQDSSLVLLAKGKVLLNRINEFSDTAQPLQAFLYSDSTEKSQLYAVGSIIQINGGFYSKGPLEINTFRGTFRSLPDQSAKEARFASGNVTATDDIVQSRLVMEYNDGVFQQIDTLPVSNQLQLFVGQAIKQ